MAMGECTQSLQSERSNDDWFTPIQQKKDGGNNDDEDNEKDANADDSLVVDSKTLYHALWFFQGVQIARDNHNETLLVDVENKDSKNKNKNKKLKSSNAGCVCAKRQSFRRNRQDHRSGALQCECK